MPISISISISISIVSKRERRIVSNYAEKRSTVKRTQSQLTADLHGNDAKCA